MFNKKTCAKRNFIILLSKKVQCLFFVALFSSVVDLANLEACLFKILPEVRIRF